MRLSEQVADLEEDFAVLEGIYKNELERELKQVGVHLQNLTCYSSHITKRFYPIIASNPERSIGLILPFKKLIFHNLNNFYNKDNKEIFEALFNLSERRGYHMEYNEFAHQHLPIIEDIMKGKLPKC